MKRIKLIYLLSITILTGSQCLAQTVKTDSTAIKDKKDTVKQLNQVVIQARKPVLERKGDRLIFNVEGNAATAGNPLLDVMRMIPGLSVTNDKLNIRGKEGLVIMIDNRRTYMSGDDLLSYLKNTPAEAISQVELITNPSAKYDAEGNAGIINIKTKRSLSIGTTGTLTQSISYGRFIKSNTGGQLTYTGSKLSLYGNSYLGYNKSFDNYYSETSSTGAEQLRTNSYSENITKNSYSYQAGFDYHFNPRSTFGGVLEGSLRPDNAVDGLSTVERTGAIPQYILTDNLSHTNNRNNSVNLHYNWENTNDNFSTDLNYAAYGFNSHSGQSNDYYNSAAHELITGNDQLRNRSTRNIDVLAGKADYTHKWNAHHSLESGIKWSHVQTDADLVYEQLQGTDWINDPGRTNHYRFSEDIYAGYLNYNGQFGGLNVQAGLRAEETNNKGLSETLNSRVKRNYLKLFPSVFLSDSFLKDHSWSFSYSYRVDRPTYSYLNPFIFINNPYNYFRGNPYLNPQYTHNFEGNYDFKKMFFLTIGYSHTEDLITEISERGDQPDVIGGTRTNINSLDSYNITFSVQLHPVKGWNVNLSAGGFRNAVRYDKGFMNSHSTFNTSMSSSVSLPAGITADINGNYQSAMSYGTTLFSPMYGVNSGLKKSFGKLSLRVSVSDVFNLQRMKYKSNYSGISSSGLNTTESRVGRLSLSYKFGKVKGAVKRNTGADEEKGRASY